MLASLGQLWASGVAVDWDGFHQTERRARVSLPTYPFERRSYWIGARPGRPVPRPFSTKPATRRTGSTVRSGERSRRSRRRPDALAGRRILVFDEETGLGAAVLDRASRRRRAADRRPAGRTPSRASAITSSRSIRPMPTASSSWLRRRVRRRPIELAGVIDCWSAAPPGATDLDTAAVVTLLGPLRLAHALSGQPTVRPLPMLLVARGTARVRDDDVLDPPRALGVGVGEGDAAGASRASSRPRRRRRRSGVRRV